MYKEKKTIVFTPTLVDGRLSIGEVLQNDFDKELEIVGNGDPGDPGYYYLKTVCDTPIFAGYKIANVCGFCDPMFSGNIYIIRKDPDPTETKAAIIVFDEPNGNPVDGAFSEYSPALIIECYPE